MGIAWLVPVIAAKGVVLGFSLVWDSAKDGAFSGSIVGVAIGAAIAAIISPVFILWQLG